MLKNHTTLAGITSSDKLDVQIMHYLYLAAIRFDSYLIDYRQTANFYFRTLCSQPNFPTDLHLLQLVVTKRNRR